MGVPAHVMVAEDNTLVAGAMRLLFEESGFRVTTCSTVAETVAAAASDPVDVLLLDLGLPDGSGLAALAELRRLGALPRTVVALTGRDEADVASRCIAAGCAAVLVKPVPVRELIAKVAGWAGESSGN